MSETDIPKSTSVTRDDVAQVRDFLLGLQRAAQRTGPNPCWSPRSEGARGSIMFEEGQSLFEGIF